MPDARINTHTIHYLLLTTHNSQVTHHHITPSLHHYGIENRATAKIIGDCAIKLDEHDIRIAEIGITVSPSEQKKGYAKEVLNAILDFLFGSQNIHRVVEIVDAENTASIQLLKSAGFRQEGHLIENIFFKGKWGSEYQYAMLKREWAERQSIADD